LTRCREPGSRQAHNLEIACSIQATATTRIDQSEHRAVSVFSTGELEAAFFVDTPGRMTTEPAWNQGPAIER
jgi:hypothetical protein